MAKGIATEDELAAAIGSVGVLSAVAKPRVRPRDDPFAATALRSMPASEALAASGGPEQVPLAPSVAPVPGRRPETPPRPSIEEPVAESGRYTEDVTVPMTAEMRTRANLLAAELQRRRTERRVRFTSNTIFRVAIETILERFELAPDDRVNSEEELRRLVYERISAQKRAKCGTS